VDSCVHLRNITMKVYKDIVSGDELFMDTYPMELLHDAVYKVEGKYISRNKVGGFVLEGANASAEEADEGTDDNDTESGLDIVLNNRLTETGFKDKKAYLTYLKDYMKRIVGKLEEEGSKDIETFKAGSNAFIKEKLSQYKDMQFFQGETMDPDAMAGILLHEDKADGNEAPFFYFFKHGLLEEKC